MRKYLVVASILVAAAGQIRAQSFEVAHSKIREKTWTWTAIYTVDQQSQPIVHSVVTIQDQEAATGDNLMVVWFIRGEPWSSQSWTTSDPWEAINWIKSELDIGRGITHVHELRHKERSVW